MTITVTTVSNNQSFGGWLATTNRLANIASQNTVTVDYTSGGSLSTGNGYVNGYFGANNIYVAAGLSGGNISSNGVLNIVSNTAFKYSSSNLVVLTANSTQSVLTINVDTVSITGNTIFANTISVGNSTVNSVINSTSITANAVTFNTISVGNSTVNSVINSTSITANAVTFNTISVGNSTVNSVINSTSLASINSTSITSNSITANAIIAYNTISVGNSTVNSVINSTSFTANSITSNVIIANGSFGTANQVLSSNGTGLYWANVAAGATFVRQTFTANSTVNTTFTITNGYTVNAIDIYENGVKLINGTDVTANNGTTITLANSALVGTTVDVVGLLSASVYSLNINTVSQGFAFSWTNNHVFNSNVDFYSALSANSISVSGNATFNAIIANSISVGNSTVNSVINSTSFTANTISVGNSTVNSVINSTSFTANSISVSGNATINAIIANGSIGTANQVLLSNGAGIYWSNSATVAAGAQIYTALNFGGF